jgi:hypothetical protein
VVSCCARKCCSCRVWGQVVDGTMCVAWGAAAACVLCAWWHVQHHAEGACHATAYRQQHVGWDAVQCRFYEEPSYGHEFQRCIRKPCQVDTALLTNMPPCSMLSSSSDMPSGAKISPRLGSVRSHRPKVLLKSGS